MHIRKQAGHKVKRRLNGNPEKVRNQHDGDNTAHDECAPHHVWRVKQGPTETFETLAHHIHAHPVKNHREAHEDKRDQKLIDVFEIQ